jgi:rRNA maturation endonuclease Nob1
MDTIKISRCCQARVREKYVDNEYYLVCDACGKIVDDEVDEVCEDCLGTGIYVFENDDEISTKRCHCCG